MKDVRQQVLLLQSLRLLPVLFRTCENLEPEMDGNGLLNGWSLGPKRAARSRVGRHFSNRSWFPVPTPSQCQKTNASIIIIAEKKIIETGKTGRPCVAYTSLSQCVS